MIRKILCFAVAMSFAFSLQAQLLTTKNKAAIKLYHDAKIMVNRSERVATLEQAIKKDKYFIEAYWAIAETYIKVDSLGPASEILRRALAVGTAYEDRTYLLMAEICTIAGDYQRALETLENVRNPHYFDGKERLTRRCNTAIWLMEHPVPFEPVNLEQVNTTMDDYFPSITADGEMISTTVADRSKRNRGQEDLYYSVRIGDQWTKSEPLAALNTDGNEGSQSFSSDGRYMFFVACDRKESVGGCDIYYSIRMGDHWSVPINPGEPLNTEFWESNPMLSPAGDELFYVTNRNGNSDIWHCDVTFSESGVLTFKNPRPLGPPINTDKDEYAPFIHADNQTLFFASNGHPGLGKNDIFVSRRKGNTWSKPQNIGYPINTEGDEMSFVVAADGTKAYFTSSRLREGRNDYDIYEISVPDSLRPQPMHVVKGRIIDQQTHKPLSAYIEIFAEDGSTKIFESLSDLKDGSFTAYIPKGQSGIDARKKGYLFYTNKIDANQDTLLIELIPAKEGEHIILHNLYFDFNSATIDKRSKKDINNLYQFLSQNKFVTIRIEGHTDNVGTDAYNNTLSQQRAEALKQVLVRMGIDANRIEAIGKGNTQSISTNETEEGRAQNRRVEVHIESNPAIK